MIPTPTELLEHKLDELARHLEEPSLPAAMDVAGIVRQLIQDGSPLMDVVNRERRLKVRFRVARFPSFADVARGDPSTTVYWGPALVPDASSRFNGVRALRRGEFLAAPAVQTAHVTIQVSHFVSYGANKAGGVHFDPSRDKETTRIDALVRALDTPDRPVFASTILAIGRVTHSALTPLRDALQRSA